MSPISKLYFNKRETNSIFPPLTLKIKPFNQ
jgi:hypothetical protein